MHSEKQLYEECLQGNDTARRQLFDLYLPVMHAICIRYSNSITDADDLVQEGFIKVFSKIDTFSWKGKGSFVSWMKTIFINSSINNYRKKSKDIICQVDDNDKVIVDHIDEQDADSIIERALDIFSQDDILYYISQLPEQFRIVFNLFAIEGLKHKQIASMLDIPIKTSTTRYLRAKSKLKAILSAKLDEVSSDNINEFDFAASSGVHS